MLFFYCFRAHPHLPTPRHSFPTRRSSDLFVYKQFTAKGRQKIYLYIELNSIIQILLFAFKFYAEFLFFFLRNINHARLSGDCSRALQGSGMRSEEHTAELQAPRIISYAVCGLKKKNS